MERVVCKKCKQSFPETTEYFYRQTHTANGLNSLCKKCYSKQVVDRKKAAVKDTSNTDKRKLWSEEDIKFLEDNLDTSPKILANKLKRSYGSVCMMKTKIKRKQDIKQYVSDEDKQYIAAWFNEIGMSEITATMDLNANEVKAIYNDMVHNGLLEEYKVKYWEQE